MIWFFTPPLDNSDKHRNDAGQGWGRPATIKVKNIL